MKVTERLELFRRERLLSTTIQFLTSSKRLEALKFSMPYLGANGNGTQVTSLKLRSISSTLKLITPTIACVPRITVSVHSDIGKGFNSIFSSIEEIASKKLQLEICDVQGLGREAEETKKHPLFCLAQLLQDRKVAGELVANWNERYG